jgi:hypothetical protein
MWRDDSQKSTSILFLKLLKLMQQIHQRSKRLFLPVIMFFKIIQLFDDDDCSTTSLGADADENFAQSQTI